MDRPPPENRKAKWASAGGSPGNKAQNVKGLPDINWMQDMKDFLARGFTVECDLNKEDGVITIMGACLQYKDTNTGRGPATVLTNPRDAPGFDMVQLQDDLPKFTKEIKDENEQEEYVAELKEFFELFGFTWTRLN